MDAERAHKPGQIPTTSRTPTLGRCPECKQSFSKGLYAMQCCLCKNNYHVHCLDKTALKNEDSVKTIKTISGNIICGSCEAQELQNAAESTVIADQLRAAQTKLRAKEEESERREAHSRAEQTRLNEQIQQLMSSPNAGNQEMANEFYKLQAEHTTAIKMLQEQQKQFKQDAAVYQAHAEKAMEEKTVLAEHALNEIKLLKEENERLAARNMQIERQQNDMQMDDIGEYRRDFVRLENAMATQQQKLMDMITASVSPLRQVVTELVDRRMAAIGHTTPATTSTSAVATNNANETQHQQQMLLKATDTTFAEALYTNSPKGKFSIEVPDDKRQIIDNIEEDHELTDCGRCQVIERRTPTSLAVTTDEVTPVCIREKIRAKYPDAQVKEPDATPKYRIKITGCKAKAIDKQNSEPTQEQLNWAESMFRKFNKIPAEKLFKVERMWTLQGKSINYTNYIVEVDAILHKRIIREGRINEGFAQRRVTEHVDILQCKHCWRFGHLKRTCTFQPTCKNCAGEHTSDGCPVADTKPICANCVRHNTTTTASIPTSHSVAADNCPVRINRIERLRMHFTAPQRKLINYKN